MADDYRAIFSRIDATLGQLTETSKTLAAGHSQLLGNQVATQEQIGAMTNNVDRLVDVVGSLQEVVSSLSADLQAVKASLEQPRS